jgi:hypothetical protein
LRTRSRARARARGADAKERALGPIGRGSPAAARTFHHHGEKPEPLDLHERRGAVSHIQDALDDFTGLAARFVGKLWHSLLFD